jgi:hypothetical protein
MAQSEQDTADDDPKSFGNPGPRLDRDPIHIHKCHCRWVKDLNRPATPDAPDHWCEQQCGGCRFYIKITGGFRSDWGVCTNEASPRDGRATFEHDGCDAFVADENGWS